ncbi:hypothetical protein ACFQY3_23220 [Paenibacillus farraposensis]|nr:hypothetical protein [Paenibacillus farraposensis]
MKPSSPVVLPASHTGAYYATHHHLALHVVTVVNRYPLLAHSSPLDA